MQPTKEQIIPMLVLATDDAMDQAGSIQSVVQGEYVLVDVGAPISSGDVVAAYHDGELVIRMYELQGGSSFLVPLNPKHQRIELQGARRILGRVDISETGRGAVRLLHALRAMSEAQKDLLMQSISGLDDLQQRNAPEAAYQEYTAQIIEKMKAAA